MIKRKTLNQEVYEYLKANIINKTIEPGEKINEVQLAKELGVSPTPVREAIRLLSSEGFVETLPWKGSFVKKIDIKDILDIYRCREALEVKAVEIAMENINSEDLKFLENLLEESKNAIVPKEIVEINTQIHDFIIKKADNERLEELLGSLQDILMTDRRISANDEKRNKEIIKEHNNIIYSMKEGNVEEAMLSMKIHIQNGCKYRIENKEE